MFYLIVKRNKKEIISNQQGMEALYQVLINDVQEIKKMITSSLYKQETVKNSFGKESLLVFQTQDICINLINRRFIELKDLTSNDKFISSILSEYNYFLKLLDDWDKFNNDEWKQFIILFNGENFILTPIYNDNSVYVKNIIEKNKNKSYSIIFFDRIENNTFAHLTTNNPALYLICSLFGESTFLIYDLDEIKEFEKSSDYGISHERISINYLNDNLIEIADNSQKFDYKIILIKENFLKIVKEWHDLQNEFDVYDTFDLKKLKLTYSNNIVDFDYELDPDIIKELAEKKIKRMKL